MAQPRDENGRFMKSEIPEAKKPLTDILREEMMERYREKMFELRKPAPSKHTPTYGKTPEVPLFDMSISIDGLTKKEIGDVTGLINNLLHNMMNGRERPFNSVDISYYDNDVDE